MSQVIATTWSLKDTSDGSYYAGGHSGALWSCHRKEALPFPTLAESRVELEHWRDAATLGGWDRRAFVVVRLTRSVARRTS